MSWRLVAARLRIAQICDPIALAHFYFTQINRLP